MKNPVPFRYIASQDLYYDVERQGKPIKLKTALERLKATGLTSAEAMSMLATTSLAPMTDSEYEAAKAGNRRTQLDWNTAYDEVQSILPMYSLINTKGERQIYACDDFKQVSLIYYKDDNNLVNSLMANTNAWCKFKEFYANSELLMGHRDKVSLRTFIIRIMKDHLLLDEGKLIQEQPKRFSWDKDELAFKKFDESLVQPGVTPTWDEFTNRLDYPDVFKAWVWSLFEPTNNIRQAMWLTGAGNDGKSAVQKALREVFGPGHVYDCKKGDEGRQWFQGNVFGKCLVNYADCDNPYLLNMQAIKQLTGGDATSIEAKGLSAFGGEIYAKLFVSSNMPPKINPDFEAQLSRLIRLKLLPISKDAAKDEQFKARLVAEVYAFLFQCREAFNKHINEGNDALILPAQLQTDIVTECATENYYIIQEFIKKYIEFGPDFQCLPSELNQRLKLYTGSEQMMEQRKISYFLQDFQAKLDSLGIKMRSTDNDSAIYLGFRFNNLAKEKLK